MRIAILALGSRGDVQPFIALARGLETVGHTVRILAAEDYAPLVQSYGVAFAPVIGRIDQLMDRELVYRFLDHTGNPVAMALEFLKGVEPVVLQLMQDCWRAGRDADVLITSSLGILAGYHIAEKQGIPSILVHLHPNAPTRAFPSMFFPRLDERLPLGGTYNLLTHRLGGQALWQLLRGQLNTARRTVLGLPPLSMAAVQRCAAAPATLTLHAYSTVVAPAPSDWGEHLPITGYWFLDQPPAWQPPQELVDFIASGPAPVYVGFGSNLIGRHPEKVSALIVQALADAGVRAVLHSGWGDLGNANLPPSVFKIGSVPHDWLLPRMAAAVHHGAAGTTAAVLRAGLPSVAVPFFGDQLFWASRLSELGAGLVLPRRELSRERLATAIRRALAVPRFRTRAAELGACLRAEDGVGRAVQLIDRQLVHSDRNG